MEMNQTMSMTKRAFLCVTLFCSGHLMAKYLEENKHLSDNVPGDKMAGISHLVCAFLPVDTDGDHGVNAERDSEDLFEQNDWTKNVTKDPLLEQGLGECERHANG